MQNVNSPNEKLNITSEKDVVSEKLEYLQRALGSLEARGITPLVIHYLEQTDLNECIEMVINVSLRECTRFILEDDTRTINRILHSPKQTAQAYERLKEKGIHFSSGTEELGSDFMRLFAAEAEWNPHDTQAKPWWDTAQSMYTKAGMQDKAAEMERNSKIFSMEEGPHTKRDYLHEMPVFETAVSHFKAKYKDFAPVSEEEKERVRATLTKKIRDKIAELEKTSKET
jgi:hypothetical protein